MSCIHEPKNDEQDIAIGTDSIPVLEKPIPDKAACNLDSVYCDTGQYLGDFSPVEVGNWWKYTTKYRYSQSRAFPVTSYSETGDYSFEILKVDTPIVTARVQGVFIVEESTSDVFETRTITDTIVLDSTFTFVDCSNSLIRPDFRHAEFPLYKSHYAKRDLDSGTFYHFTKMDPIARQIQYRYNGTGGSSIKTYAEGIGLINETWSGGGMGQSISGERVLIEKHIKSRRVEE